MLNNYLVWKLMDRYDVELSWEYLHASREFYVDRYGIPQFLGTWMYCFRNMDSYLGDALSSMYVRDHFVDKNKQKVRRVTFMGYVILFQGRYILLSFIFFIWTGSRNSWLCEGSVDWQHYAKCFHGWRHKKQSKGQGRKHQHFCTTK